MNGAGHDGGRDEHEHDVVMPGFRFHPTEEELLEFYLRRKVEGRRFNVELIAYLDLYRYDPWELPAFATIGDKEWFFYVPRDRKYRNGDRPNRVTTSGYWKATGADRMVKGEGGGSRRPIGLKKTLVFYTGKAPKGVRTGWIMNEYRLPHNEYNTGSCTSSTRSGLQKAEISLCRVYKRTGVVEHRHHQLPGTLPSRPSSSRGPLQLQGSAKKRNQQATAAPNLHNTLPPSSNNMEKLQGTPGAGASISATDIAMTPSAAAAVQLPPTKHEAYSTTDYVAAASQLSSTTTEEDAANYSLQQQPNDVIMGDLQVIPTCRFLGSLSSPAMAPAAAVDELNKMVGFQHGGYVAQASTQLFPLHLVPQPQLPITSSLPATSLAAVTDKLSWEYYYWNSAAAAPAEADQINYAGFKY